MVVTENLRRASTRLRASGRFYLVEHRLARLAEEGCVSGLVIVQC